MSHRKRFWLTLLLIILSSILFSMVVWTAWGYDLHLNVYFDNEVMYREEFPPYFKVIVTVLLGNIFGLFVAAVIWLIHFLRWLSLHGREL